MVARREHAFPHGAEDPLERALEPEEARLGVREPREGAGRQLQLGSGLQRDGLAGPRHAQKVAFRVVGGLREVGLQLAEDPLRSVRLAVGDRPQIVVDEDVLQLDAQLA